MQKVCKLQKRLKSKYNLLRQCVVDLTDYFLIKKDLMGEKCSFRFIEKIQIKIIKVPVANIVYKQCLQFALMGKLQLCLEAKQGTAHTLGRYQQAEEKNEIN